MLDTSLFEQYNRDAARFCEEMVAHLADVVKGFETAGKAHEDRIAAIMAGLGPKLDFAALAKATCPTGRLTFSLPAPTLPRYPEVRTVREVRPVRLVRLVRLYDERNGRN